MNNKAISLLITLGIIFSTMPAMTVGATAPTLSNEEQAVLSLLDYERAWQQLNYRSTFRGRVRG